tara:strand:- start:15 stop:725 length:711 start_codon:yes stop_codon:yes gene_type:complete
MIEDESCKEKLKNIFRTIHKKHTLININKILNDVDRLTEEAACRILENRELEVGRIWKNQIASTKGKTFQLDFNQPMIEEKEQKCKERFIQLLENAKSVKLGDGKESQKSQGYRVHRMEGKVSGINSVLRTTAILEKDIEQIPEEVFCKILEMIDKKETLSVKVKGYVLIFIMANRVFNRRDELDYGIYIMKEGSEGDLISIMLTQTIYKSSPTQNANIQNEIKRLREEFTNLFFR